MLEFFNSPVVRAAFGLLVGLAIFTWWERNSLDLGGRE